MSGRPKKGIDYSGWSVDIFENDIKIDELLDAQGWNGFSIYFYLCQRAYGSEGYFYRWSYANAATTARRMGGGIGSETVKQTVAVCLQIGLFDKRLFDLGGVLTSKGIQRRFAQAIQTRRCKTVNRDIWLLDDAETGSYGIVLENSDLLQTNSHLQEANNHLQEADRPKSKAKQSKVIIPAKQGKGAASQTAEKQVFTEMINSMDFSPELSGAVKDWVAYKGEKKQGYKETGLRNLLSRIRGKAEELGDAVVVDVIRTSMGNNYQGIIWDLASNKPSAIPNRFNNFPQRKYDYSDLEKRILDTRKETG